MFWALQILSISALILCTKANVRLPDQQETITSNGEEGRNGRHLLDFVDFVTSGNKPDPLISKARNYCGDGEMSECFRAQALDLFSSFFDTDNLKVSESVKILKLPESQVRSLENEPYEYVSEPKSTDSDWEELVKFMLRKAERFVKSHAFEVEIPHELQNDEKSSPRFINEIDDELDVIEDKKAPFLIKHRLKKMFIPMLLILKLFKLKLLLFLPFIVGIAGFKKVLGFLAFVVPGIIGYLKLCRGPNFTGGFFNNKQNYAPHYNAQGVSSTGYSNYYNQQSVSPSYFNNGYRNFEDSSSVKFNEESFPQNLAYSGYAEYRNKNTSIEGSDDH